MKKLYTLCIVGAAFALSACNTAHFGNVDTQPPYNGDRTATHSDYVAPMPAKTMTAPVRTERVFKSVQSK